MKKQLKCNPPISAFIIFVAAGVLCLLLINLVNKNNQAGQSMGRVREMDGKRLYRNSRLGFSIELGSNVCFSETYNSRGYINKGIDVIDGSVRFYDCVDRFDEYGNDDGYLELSFGIPNQERGGGGCNEADHRDVTVMEQVTNMCFGYFDHPYRKVEYSIHEDISESFSQGLINQMIESIKAI